ncbi:hypothetical protein F5I97DRAFT_315981 [Phlebopus sp. FC_14]|nr:hypothetical protein F5I97DRAFT_315981 [Phlebopus sp. FC_14]
MLELPQPDHAETVDGCPQVNLPQDTTSDWIAALSWMYDRNHLESRSTAFNVVAGNFQLNTRSSICELGLYQMLQICEAATYFPKSNQYILPPDDWRCLIIGRGKLQDHLLNLLACWDSNTAHFVRVVDMFASPG